MYKSQVLSWLCRAAVQTDPGYSCHLRITLELERVSVPIDILEERICQNRALAATDVLFGISNGVDTSVCGIVYRDYATIDTLCHVAKELCQGADGRRSQGVDA